MRAALEEVRACNGARCLQNAAPLKIASCLGLQGECALLRREVPVGCVFVDASTNEIVCRASNRTGELSNVRALCDRSFAGMAVLTWD